MPNKNTRQAVLDALKAAGTPLDAHQIAQRTGLSPMQAGRTLVKLVLEKQVCTPDPLDAADGALAARFELQ